MRFGTKAGDKFPSLPLMGRVADSLLSAGWRELRFRRIPPARRAGRLGFAEIGTRRPPHVGGGMEFAKASLLNFAIRGGAHG
jgi:hypothetical protein